MSPSESAGGPLAHSNPHVQRLRRLLGRRSSRHEEGAFVVEGGQLVAEAVAAGWDIEAQFVGPGGEPVDGAGTVHQLAAGVVERVASTETPRPLLAVVRMRRVDPAVLQRASFVLVADQIADPGNAGTMMRSAEASGADAVAFTGGAVDIYNPKVVRASAGALFHVPCLEAVTLRSLHDAGLHVFGTTSHGEAVVEHTDADFRQRLALVVGNEAHGLAADADVDEWITIPHGGRAESLNVAMAATVLCFEVARQRRT